MDILSFDDNSTTNTFSNKDILSVFRKHTEKPTTIQEGMSVQEISEVVSDKVMAVVKEQFQATKEKFQKGQTKK